MTRGDVVVVSLPGYGKPGPALVIQSVQFADHPSVTLLPITSHLIEAPLLRIDIGPGAGLDRPSQVRSTRRTRRGGCVSAGLSDTLMRQRLPRSIAHLRCFLGWSEAVTGVTTSKAVRSIVDLLGYPDLVVIYVGLRASPP
jgi:mRNA-degrading endonuclease toxin of MazEF toxin-antitoxin module